MGLSLSRKTGEAVLIGEDIIIRVLSVNGPNVKLSIEAPKDVKILRNELVDATIKHNQEATQWNLNDLSNLQALKTEE